MLVNIGIFLLLHGADRENLNVRGAMVHVLGDLFGSAGAIVAAIVIMTTGWTPADPLISVLVAVIILEERLARRARFRPHPARRRAGRPAVAEIAVDLQANIAGVEDVHHVHAWSITQERPMVTLHARICEAADADSTVVAIKSRLNARFGVAHATVEIERGDCADSHVAPSSEAHMHAHAHSHGRMLVDSHCHLDFPDFDADRDAVVARARDAGVGTMVTISTRVAKFAGLKAITERYERICCSIGTHPHNAADEPDVTADDLARIADDPAVVAIGEAGLDYHYDNSPREAQREGFLRHIAAARMTQLAAGYPRPRRRCRRGAKSCATKWGRGPSPPFSTASRPAASSRMTGVELGLHVSFSGILTFKRSEELRAIAAEIPLDRLLVETDAPYLAPPPHRGTRNEPAYVVETAKVLAEVKGISYEALAAATSDNFFRLFNKVPRGVSARLRATILGCGSSPGVPRIGNDWGACDPQRATQPAHALFAAARAVSMPATRRRGCWSIPARTCAPSCWRPTSASSTR